MGNVKQIKQIRGQLRIIAKDILPEVLNEEVQKVQYARLQKEVQVKLDLIEKDVKDTLDRIDERARDMQMLMVRQLAAGMPAPQTQGDTVNEQKQEPKDCA